MMDRLGGRCCGFSQGYYISDELKTTVRYVQFSQLTPGFDLPEYRILEFRRNSLDTLARFFSGRLSLEKTHSQEDHSTL